jgi:serine/threonine-protein kinase
MQPGLFVAPNLKLVRPIGKGGMGTVWVAEHRALGREVAVKFLSDELARDLQAVARFEREASAVAELANDHVVEVIEHGVTEAKLPYMATELLEGEDLGALLHRERRVEAAMVADILDQVCDALGAAHALGIVHRDIKPENVFLLKGDGPLEVRLLDFGIAKRWQDPRLDVTSTGVVVGTPHYMSPEQFLSAKHVDYRADLWSLGVLAYRAVTGRLPFEAQSFAALCIQIHRGIFPRPTAYRAELPIALNPWFAKALRGHPAARFASASQMAESFRQAIEGECEVAARPLPNRRVPPPDWARGDPALEGKAMRLASSGGSDAVTVDLGRATRITLTAGTGNEIAPVRTRRRLILAVAAGVALAIAIAVAAFVRPSAHGEPSEARTLAEPRAEPPEESLAEPVTMPEPANVEMPNVEIPLVRIVAGPASGAARVKKPSEAAPPPTAPSREPDRGF